MGCRRRHGVGVQGLDLLGDGCLGGNKITGQSVLLLQGSPTISGFETLSSSPYVAGGREVKEGRGRTPPSSVSTVFYLHLLTRYKGRTV